MATMRQMKIALRRRMGEPIQGTWGKYRYQENREGEKTDELLETINESQNIVARDMHANSSDSYPFVRYDVEIPVVANQDIYTMPEDFMAVDELRYIRRSQNYPMKRRSIKSVRFFDERTFEAGVLQYYDYKGLINTYIAEGVVDETSETTIHDALASLSFVRIGDIVYNITDDSQGFVTAFEDGNTIIDGLQGGRSNIFTRGDSYAIATAEENRWALQVYPRITTTDIRIYEGDPLSIELQASDVIPNTGISVQISELPEGFQDDEVVLFAIFEGEDLLENPRGPSEYGRTGIRTGYNLLDRPSILTHYGDRYNFNVQLRQNISYSLRAYREDGTELPLDSVRLSRRPDDRMLMTYARLPRYMKNDESVCEFANEFNEAILKRAKMILHEKLNNQGVSPQLTAEYEYELNNINMSLLNRDESEPVEIDTDGEIIEYQRDARFTPYYS